jgi:tetratricopeptide (TPR) repeat protein
MVLLSLSANAQDATMQNIQQLVSQRKFKTAEKLLGKYAVSHQDAPTLWYYAQVAHWAHDDKTAERNFKIALNEDPGNTKLQLDYARMLFESGQLNRSKKQLDNVIRKDDNDVEAHLIRSNIAFWYGHIRPARADIKNVTDTFPDNPAAKNLRTVINESTAPYLKYTVGYLNDDQPLQAIGNTVEAGICYSWLLSPRVQVTDQDFYAQSKWNSTLWASFSNKFLFGKTGTDVDLSIGAFKNFSSGADWTGDVTVHQKLYRYFGLQLEAQRKPYLSTITSTSLSLMQNNLSATLIFDKSNSWTAQAAYRYQVFDDKNPIQTAYAWVLSQPIKVSVFQFRFGYSYNFSTSAHSRFTATESVAQLLANYSATEQISGIYVPYFTPIKQHTNTLIVSIKIHPVRFMDIGIKGDIGFYAQAQNPYLYLDSSPTDAIFINQGFARQVFHPYKLSANIDFKIGRKVTLGADYAYTSGFFYSNHYTSLHLHISFLKHAD